MTRASARPNLARVHPARPGVGLFQIAIGHLDHAAGPASGDEYGPGRARGHIAVNLAARWRPRSACRGRTVPAYPTPTQFKQAVYPAKLSWFLPIFAYFFYLQPAMRVVYMLWGLATWRVQSR